MTGQALIKQMALSFVPYLLMRLPWILLRGYKPWFLLLDVPILLIFGVLGYLNAKKQAEIKAFTDEIRQEIDRVTEKL